MKRVAQRNRRNATPESLEQRALLTPIIVTSLADNTIDDNETTLREAVEEARNDPFGYADIAFAPGLSGVINLTEGRLDLGSGELTITGNGRGKTIIDAGGNSDIFHS